MMRQKLHKLSNNSLRERFTRSNAGSNNNLLNDFMENQNDDGIQEEFELQSLSTFSGNSFTLDDYIQAEEEEEEEEEEIPVEHVTINTKATKESDSIQKIWEINDITLSKKEQRKEEIQLDKSGCYQFTFTKMDKFASRIVSIGADLTRDGKVIANRNGGIGGLKWQRIHRMEFTISKPASVNLTFICGSITSLGRVRFSVSLVSKQKQLLINVKLTSYLNMHNCGISSD